MIELNPGLTIWTIVVFVIFLTLLRAFAWKPILTALSGREEKIRESVEGAERARAEAERIIAENRAAMVKAEEQIQTALREGRALAEKMKTEAGTKAQEEAKRMLDNAKSEINRSRDAALNSLREEVANLAIGAAGKILDETLDPAKHKKVVENYLKQTKN